MAVGPLQNSPNREDLPLRQRLARVCVLGEMLSPKIGFQFLPTLSGVTQSREKPSLESTNRMCLGEEVPVQLLRIDLRQMSLGQQHVLILPSSSLFASSRMPTLGVDRFNLLAAMSEHGLGLIPPYLPKRQRVTQDTRRRAFRR